MSGPSRLTRARCVGDDGSSLMLMPAAVMVVLCLGAIAVDLSVVQLARRDLLDVAASAANDAAGYGLDPAAFRQTGAYRIDLARALGAARRAVLAHNLGNRVTELRVVPGPAADQVTVELTMPVDYVFAKALPGAHDGTVVTARATASAARR